jgi:ADP-heptose:LPS heptosyltransferase
VPRCPLRFELPAAARAAAERRLTAQGADSEGARWIAVMPAGSSEPGLYPSAASWRLILDALAEQLPGVRFALIGKLRRDRRTASAVQPADVADLLAHHTRPVDCFDVDLAEQLAIVEACDLFLSPHTGFGLAALAVATPWLTISPADAGSSTTSTTSRSGRSYRTSSGTPRSASSSRRRWSRTVKTARALPA